MSTKNPATPWGARSLPPGAEPITAENLALLKKRGIGAVKVVKRSTFDSYAVVFPNVDTDKEKSQGFAFLTPAAWTAYDTDGHHARRAWFHFGIGGVEPDAASYTLLRSVPKGGYLLFEAAIDGHRNGYVRDAGLHADVLYAHTFDSKGKWTGRHEVANSICPDNTARPTYQWPSEAVTPAEAKVAA